jgi:4'-phosphopantetheinyl transferase
MTCSDSHWHRPRGDCALAADEVQVWRATLDQPQEQYSELMGVLSHEERARAGRYHFEADRKRSVLGRGLARILLGRCLGEPPERLAFEYNEFGKPQLADAGKPSVEFNLSHSGELVLIALARGRIVGVDVEHVRPDMASGEIAARFFSPNECRVLAALPAEERCAAFFSCWTRKEAYLKARGDGLSLPLNTFDVAFAPGEEPRVIETRHDPAEAGRWQLRALHPGYGCKAALAAEGDGWQVKCWNWTADATAP